MTELRSFIVYFFHSPESRSRQCLCDSGNCFKKKNISNGINTGKLRTKKKENQLPTMARDNGGKLKKINVQRAATYYTYPECLSEFDGVSNIEIFRFIKRSRFSLKYYFKMSSKLCLMPAVRIVRQDGMDLPFRMSFEWTIVVSLSSFDAVRQEP